MPFDETKSPTLLEIIRFYQSKQDRYRFFRFPLWAVFIPEGGPSLEDLPKDSKLGFDALVRFRSLRVEGICLEVSLEQGVLQVRRDEDVIAIRLNALIPSRKDETLFSQVPRVGILRGLVEREKFSWNRIMPYVWNEDTREFIVYHGSYLGYAKSSLLGDEEDHDPDYKTWWTLSGGMRTVDQSYVVDFRNKVLVIDPEERRTNSMFRNPNDMDIPDATHEGTYAMLRTQLGKALENDLFFVNEERMIEFVKVPEMKIKDVFLRT